MKKVLIFTENNWVFGKIHNELIKAIYPEVYCDILEYTYVHWADNISLYMDKYDYFLSNTWGAYMLHSKYNVPADRIIGVAHGEIDLHLISQVNRETDLNFINNLKGYAVICPHLYNLSINSDITRKPHILRVGLNTHLYKFPRQPKLETLGYLGAYKVNWGYGDIKRGFLAEKLAYDTGLNFFTAKDYHFLGVEQLYKNVDLVVFCSLTEGNPYSALEGFATGIPVLGTPTGLFPELANSGGGKILPFDETEFVQQGVEFINELKNNKNLYMDMCDKALKYSKSFDWSILRYDWINYIYSL